MTSKLIKILSVLAALALSLLPAPARAMDVSWDWQVDGAINGALIDWYGLGDLPAEQSLLELGRLRFSGNAWLGNQANFKAAYELNALAGSTRQGLGLGLGDNTDLRLTDLNRNLVEEDDFVLAQNLDRLSVFYSAGPELGGWRLTLGRQAISHGEGRFFNPTDIFAPVSPQATYSQYKAGVDALRLTLPYKESGEVELWLVGHNDDQGDAWGRSYYLVRGRYMFTGAEVSGFAGYSLGQPTLGLSISGDAAGATLYAEALLRFDEKPFNRLRAMVGAQRRFDLGTGLNVFIEGHYNGPGRDDPADYGQVIAGPEYQNGELFLTGRWFGVISADYQPHPLVTCTLMWLQSFTDGSALVLPIVDYEALQWLTIRLGASIGLGQRPEVVSTPFGQFSRTKSEFGSYPNQVYLEFRFTF